jgi:hypothetical protein
MPIPPDIDELMWAIAENDTPDAVYEFEHRFPKYQQELMRRIKTVQALRAQGRTVPARDIPAFQARPVTVDSKPVQWLGYAAVSIAVISTAVLAATRNKPTPTQGPAPISVKAPEPTKVRLVPRNSPPPAVATAPIDPAKNPPIQQADTLKKFDAVIEVAKLHDAIQMIAMSGKVTVTIAPGLENPEVQVNFTHMTAMEMLFTLGKDYAFTPVINGENDILILPVKDDSEPNEGKEELN